MMGTQKIHQSAHAGMAGVGVEVEPGGFIPTGMLAGSHAFGVTASQNGSKRLFARLYLLNFPLKLKSFHLPHRWVAVKEKGGTEAVGTALSRRPTA